MRSAYIPRNVLSVKSGTTSVGIVNRKSFFGGVRELLKLRSFRHPNRNGSICSSGLCSSSSKTPRLGEVASNFSLQEACDSQYSISTKGSTQRRSVISILRQSSFRRRCVGPSASEWFASNALLGTSESDPEEDNHLLWEAAAPTDDCSLVARRLEAGRKEISTRFRDKLTKPEKFPPDFIIIHLSSDSCNPWLIEI